jgi:CheY-like chemotaxis protein
VALIALTGWGQDHDRQAALAAGFDEHLTKPVDPERVERLLASFLAEQEGRAVPMPDAARKA